MAIKLPSHLHRSRSGVLHFRIAIPPDLRHHFASREIYRSLRTPSVRSAADAAQSLSIAFKRVFSEIRQQAMPDNNKAPDNALDTFASLPDVRMRLKTAGILVRAIDAEAALEGAEEQLAVSEEQRRDDHARHQRDLDLVLRAKGADGSATLPSKITPLLSETVSDFSRAKRAQDRWTEKTVEENKAVYDLFARIAGDKPIADLGDEVIVSYLETLKRLPPNINRNPLYIGKSIAEIIALAPAPMAVRTINKNLERISSLFKWAMTKDKYGISRNPAAGMSLDESSSARRLPFTLPELVALFSAKEFAARKFQKPYAYWIMPLGLLTGARLGEMAQLYLSDFVILNDVPCIEISDENEGQRLKNHNAKRLVPIHSKLIELGLLRYVETLRQKNETRLFPELHQRRDGFAQAASNWFQRHKKKCGIEGKHTKAFHSFRHTFISALLDDGVAEHLVAQIVGHEADLITGKVYWNAPDAAKRKPTVEQYQLPLAVWSLIPKIEDITISQRRRPNQTEL